MRRAGWMHHASVNLQCEMSLYAPLLVDAPRLLPMHCVALFQHNFDLQKLNLVLHIFASVLKNVSYEMDLIFELCTPTF